MHFTLLELFYQYFLESWVLSSVIKSKDPFPFRPDELYSVLKNKKYFVVTASKHEWVFNDIATSMETPYYELREAMKGGQSWGENFEGVFGKFYKKKPFVVANKFGHLKQAFTF